MKKPCFLGWCLGWASLVSLGGGGATSAGAAAGGATAAGSGADAIEQWAQQPSQPPPANAQELQPGAQIVQPPPVDPVAPVEILVKLRKGSAAANLWQQADGAAKAAGTGLTAATELSALMTKHGVTAVLPVFGRAKQLPPAEAAAALADPDSQAAKREALFRWCRLSLPAGANAAAVIADFKANPGVECAETVAEYQLCDTGIPNQTTDPKMGDQWHHSPINAQGAWTFLQSKGRSPGGSRDVVVAVIDTGVDYNHQDLVANIWTNPREIVGNGIDDDGNGFIDDIHGCSVVSDSRSHSGDPIDLHGHGTHVAGIIAATAFNSKGGVGVAFNVQIMPVRAAQSSGVLTTTDIAEAVLYAVDNGADVINMSFGGAVRSQLQEDALAMALHQAVLVAAAGNKGYDAAKIPFYPAALSFVIGVMANERNGTLWKDSNYDSTGKIYKTAAPGVGILSTLPGNQYAAWSGTSMAAPMVSGIAALTRSYYIDRVTYSSRFIMGSLRGATSLDSLGKPTGISALGAVSKLPPPGLSLSAHWLFDNKEISAKNDGDGRIDSGETIHLAIEATNASGKADNVVATLRAAVREPNDLYVDDPYVTIVTRTANLGDIGPSNTADNGFIRTGSVITGVARPLVIHVSNDCPNDHVIPFSVTFTYRDGNKLADPTVFETTETFKLIVQRGRNLPTVIDSDMVLTADDFWIVGGPVLIEPAATLTVMPGTQMQWGAVSDDPYNLGPQTGNMIVRGNLRVEGTCEQPVVMFPSYLVGGQTVNIQVQTGGTADMAYAKVRNANITGIRIIDHGFFDVDRVYGTIISAMQIKNTIFHRLNVNYGGVYADLFDGCLFGAGWLNPSPMPNSYSPKIRNCTFLQDNENNRALSIGSPGTIDLRYFGGLYWEMNNPIPATWNGMYHAVQRNGFTYLTMPAETTNYLQQADLIAQYFGGHVTSIADQAEQDFLNNYVAEPVTVQCPSGSFIIGLTDEGTNGVFRWLDGTPLNYQNWDSGYPITLPELTNRVVMLYDVPRRWRNSSGYGTNRDNSIYGGGPGFILKLPGIWTAAQVNAEVNNGNVLNFVRPRMCGEIINNAFLSKYWDSNVDTWMRVRGQSGNYSAMNFNYWGTTSTTFIDLMIVDYYDNFGSPRVDYKPASAHGYTTTYPFVEQVFINGAPAESIPKLNSGRADFTVTFNRDMDMTVEPFVTFGPISPHTDFQVTARDWNFQPMASGWLNPRTWQGSTQITPMSGEGFHLMRISGAVAASDPWLVSGYDVGRFRFDVKSMTVAAMALQANGQEGAIHLQWQQDDFEMLAGYNLYRATSATGPWTKLNTTVIPPGSENYDDLAVSPAVPMYYKFSVLSTDFQESDFSNVAMAAAIDTVAPAITHVPVTTAAPARGMRVTATATDNLRVTAVTVHYRPLGSAGDYTAMPAANLTGDQWTATIPGAVVVAPGLEYYVVATDGISEAFSGTPVLPHQVTVSNVPTLSSVAPGNGPATGGTAVTLSGMLFEPGISVLFGGVLASNVQVLNGSQLTCVTPAHFPALVDVKVINPDLTESTLLNGFRFEETGVVVSLPNTSGNFGSQVDLAVSASNLVGLRGLDLTLTWNPAVLTAVSARVGTVTAGWGLAANLNSAGRAMLSMANAGAVSGGGSLVVLRFNVIGSPPVSSPLVIESVSLNDAAMTASRSDGLFTVNGFFDLAGNVRYFTGGTPVPGVALTLAGVGTFPTTTASNGAFALTGIPTGSYLLTPTKTTAVNGITAFDASMVLQKAAGLLNLSADETRAADVNRNGAVSAMDAAYILEAAVGAIQVPFPGAGRVWDFLPEQRTYPLLNTNLTDQDFTAVLVGDVSGNWAPETASAPPAIQSGGVAFALIHDAINTPDQNTAWLLIKTTQPAIFGLDLVLSYPPGLTLNEVRAGAMGQNHSVAFHSPGAGSVRIAAASAMPVSGEGILLELRFDGPPDGLAATRVVVDEARVSAVADPALNEFDQDHDGLINTLETGVYHTDPAVADSDGDGRNDGEEVIAGTSPSDAASVFALKSFERMADQRVQLTWTSVPGRTYRVEVTETLASGNWVEAGPAITATADMTSASLPQLPNAVRAFYRVAVVAQ